MAIVSDRKMIYERKITELQTQLTEVRTTPGEASHGAQETPPPKINKYVNQCISLPLQEEPMDTDQSSTLLSSIQSEIAKYQLLIEEENQKLKRYKVSPRRRGPASTSSHEVISHEVISHEVISHEVISPQQMLLSPLDI